MDIESSVAHPPARGDADELNRRLVWERRTINEIADGIARSLELDEVLSSALACLTRAFGARGGSIRLRDETGEFCERATVGDPDPSGAGPAGGGSLRALSVPMMAGALQIGTLSLVAGTPDGFRPDDPRFLGIAAAQIVVAVQNARLHEVVRRGKIEWERTFDAISDPIAVFDAQGRLLRGNAALAEHLGRDVRSLRGETCAAMGFCGEPAGACAVRRAVAAGPARAELTQADGRIFSVTTFPIAGGAAGASVVQVAKNVTEDIRSARQLQQLSEELALANARSLAALERLKSTQAQLIQAEKLSAIGQLVAGVAHELNNPLTSVIGYAQLLEDELTGLDPAAPRSTPEIAQDLRRIGVESERAARIVRNLLAFARRQSATRVPQDVADLFGRVLALRGYEHRLNNIDVLCDFDPALPSVVADAGQIQQALLNLVLNAEQAMRGRTPRQLRASVRYDDLAAAVELSLTDTGHGIEEVNLPRIFDPFFTTREVGEGTGLGLSICYGIVRDHGGQIGVESRAGEGTTFSILLPARVEVAGEAVLVAHGDQAERDFLSAALSGWGFQPVAAGSSADAIEACGTQPLAAAFVDQGILAADLPGWRAVRAASERVPLVVISLSVLDGDVERFGRQEARAVLAPPFQLRAIRSAVRAVSKECV